VAFVPGVADQDELAAAIAGSETRRRRDMVESRRRGG
jgi:hypothetical protein